MASESLVLPRISPNAPKLRKQTDVLLVVSTAVCILLVAMSFLAPWLAPYGPNDGDFLRASQDPSPSHWLGTDEMGRDILSRLMYGGQLSLLGPAVAVFAAAVFGVTLTVSSVWIGGRYDAAVSRVIDLLFAFPGLLMAIIAVAIFGAGMVAPTIALAIAFTAPIARVVRTVALRERNLPYIEACLLAGMSPLRVCVRHLVPNVLPMLRAHMAIAFGAALIDLAAISYLGLGVQPPQAEWGGLVANGQAGLLSGHPWESLGGAAMILVVVVAVNVMADRISARTESGVAR